MNRIRTSLLALTLASAAVTTGLVATGASATPAPLAAVDAVTTSPSQASGNAALPADSTAQARQHGIRTWWKDLTDEQRTCLQKADIRRPVGRLDDVERKALRERVTTAATTCAVELPGAKAREFRASLTDDQKQCLHGASLTRPWGPLDKEQRQQLRADRQAAAKACGVTLPTRS
ncbi:MAG: hypothetical protein ABIU87_04060 [Ornithinibacter sp.]